LARASNQTYITWAGSPGTGTPHLNVVRLTLRSRRPSVKKLVISFFLFAGSMKPGFFSMWSSRSGPNLESLKK